MPMTDESIRRRHTKRQQQLRRAILMRRIVSLTVLSVIVLCIIIFATPLFNIRSVSYSGNEHIPDETLTAALDTLKGDNLILTGRSRVSSRLFSLAYIDGIAVHKKLFPPSISVEITECTPVAYLPHNNLFVTINEDGKILEANEKKPELCELAGLKLTSANEGEIISLDDNSKLKTVLAALGDFKQSGLMNGIISISFEDIDNISFNYENRLDGICGPYVDFTRKLAFFREAITSNRLTENSRGTIDLTQTGRAVYKTGRTVYTPAAATDDESKN